MSELYQINARVLINSMPPTIQSLAQIPLAFWQKLRSRGIDFIWLMGVWHTSPKSIDKYCFHPNLVAEYDNANPKWQKSNVAGSPYAIDSYSISPEVGHNRSDLSRTKKKINEAGMNLILDFVPNHLNAESQIIHDHPEYFFHSKTNLDRSVFYGTKSGYFAHGRDPYFQPWTDTVQLNYFNIETHKYMLKVLTEISSLCDGVRCDMAMLILPEIFEKTWSKFSNEKVPSNFWKDSIAATKEKKPNFIFIAEAYWDMEWRLQQEGFDYTYDKKLLDLLVEGNPTNLRNHLGAENTYRKKMVHFIENHDEPRSMTSMGRQKARAASVIISTIPGMTLFFDGQWEGARKKLPVQLAMPAAEIHCPCSVAIVPQDDSSLCFCQKSHYLSLLKAIDRPIFKKGQWHMINQNQMGELLAWAWIHKQEKIIVFINFTQNHLSTSVDIGYEPSQISHLEDILNSQPKMDYLVHDDGHQWSISLPPYQSSIVKLSIKDQN